MRTPVLNFFKRPAGSKPNTENPAKAIPSVKTLVVTMPSGWMVLFAYFLSFAFCFLAHQFFLWFPPYLEGVFKNLRGLPVRWADLSLYWSERGLCFLAVAAAVYHHLWQMSTRYQLTQHDIHIESWFPVRKVTAIPYGSVRKVGFQQSPLGLALDYGHIEIDTGGYSGPLVLPNCPRPQRFLQTLQPRVEALLQPNFPVSK